MYHDKTTRARRFSRPAILMFGVALATVSCGDKLEQVSIPALSGPSELALSLQLLANPDVITADGYSTSAIEAVVRDHNGQRLQGRDILFALADEDGNFADIGTLETPTGSRLHAGTATARTNADGVAYVVYRAPYRTDATANQSLIVTARPVTDDFNGALNRTVRIELKSAEPRLFPQVPGNAAPDCNWAVQAPGGFYVNEVILFQSTASDEDGVIVRYDWDFGDGDKDDKPDVAHAWGRVGVFTVTHVVTDDDGAQSACAADLDITTRPRN
jgi:hypothetical protein